ncbi:MAG: FAD-dependent oxidoreductase [Cyanobacteria bacterium P01_H01_bin.152]
METFEFDVVIVGGGPAGCTCALYTSRADLKTVILDKNPAVGALAITHKIANYPGVPGDISGEELLNIMRDQAVTFGADYRRGQVFGIDVSSHRKKVYTPEGTFVGRALVLATGAMGRTASFKGESEFLGRGVSYCATCDGAFYRNHEVAVIGSNQEAIEEAQVLTKFASTVHLVTFKDPPTEDPHVQDLLAMSNVKHWSRSRLLAIEGDEMGVTGIQVKPKQAKEPISLPALGVFVYQNGSKPITDFLSDQVAFNPDGGVQVNDLMATSTEGVWAIGDIRNTPFKQAVVAAGDGCVAAMAIDRFLNSRKGFRPDWDHS